MKFLILTSLLLAACTTAPKPANLEDPYLWLEEVESQKSLDWVKERNQVSEDRLTKDPQYVSIEKDFRRILLAKDRLPSISYLKGYVYNFWQDDKNVRGLWRRVKLDDYRKAIVNWETVIDVDQLAAKEKENWVWKGIHCLAPDEKNCVVFLSRGGKDASVVREFNLENKAFVKNGFNIPEAKTRVEWMSADKIFVASDFGAGTMTKSGYPRQLKVWTRGTPLSSAKLIAEVGDSDLSIDADSFDEPGRKTYVVNQATDFYHQKYSLYNADGKLVDIPIPTDAITRGVFEGYLIYTLRSDVKAMDGKVAFKQGSLLALNLANLSAAPELVYEPLDKTSIDEVGVTKNSILVGLLENVQDRIYKIQHVNNLWQAAKLQGQDRETFKDGNLSLSSTNPLEEVFIARHEDFLSPPSIVIGEDSGKGVYLYKAKTSPARFDASNMMTEQFEAVSADGTHVPYFVIHKVNMKFDGTNPTVLYGYGGFQISLTPYYLNATGKVWIENQNGVYVVANIRGGGEFGPAWHEAAVKINRQKAFDDFIAVGEDLIARKITSKNRLAIMGGSNGGLLVGATMVERPDLFKAVVCQVPLLDMLRYNQLLAGNSWMAEYGNPDVPAERAALLKYSPYQNLQKDLKYPMVFFLTSTKDDRVHPGHARKMMARMMEYGEPALYWENTEGGHAGAANLEQRIKSSALQWTFLTEELVGTATAPQK